MPSFAVPAWLRAGLPAACLAVAACDITEPRLGNGSSELEERLGTPLAGTEGMAIGAAMLWSANGSELYFEAADGSMRAVTVPGEALRTVDAPRERADLSAASAGEAVYFAAGDDPAYASVYRSAGGVLTRLTDRAPRGNALGAADGTLVLGGPADTLAAFIVAPDSLFLWSTRTGERHFVVTGCLRVVSFAPTGNALICRMEGERDNGYARVDLTAATVTPLEPLVPEAGIMRVVRWEEDALRVLYSANSRFRLRNVDQGTSVLLWSPGAGTFVARVLDFLHYSWSADGSRFAFWTHECLDINRVGACTRGQSVLYVVELKNNTGSMVAVVKGPRGGEQISMAPNGRAVAYAFNGRIWYQPLD